MPIKFLLDENLRDRRLWSALRAHNGRDVYPLDVVPVGDEDGPNPGIGDDALIAWAASHERILVALDRSTLPRHLSDFCSVGNRSPGIILPRRGLTVADSVELLVLIAYASSSEEWAITYRWILIER